MAGAPAVLAEVNGLSDAAAAKKDEMVKALGNEWRSLAASVPQSLGAVQTRIEALSKTKHVPKDIDLGAAKSALADATSAWDKAQEAFKSGNPADAVTAAKDAQGKVASAAAALKLNLTWSDSAARTGCLLFSLAVRPDQPHDVVNNLCRVLKAHRDMTEERPKVKGSS